MWHGTLKISFWLDDPKYTLALADEFGFVGKKQLVQTKNILVAPGSDNDERRFA